MSNSDEQERLKRLRARQLADRDPHVKQRHQQRVYAQREKRRANQKVTLGQMWAEIPHSYKGPFYGLLIGLVALFVVPIFWDSPWTLPCVGGGTLFFIIMGLMIGRGIDARENIKDLLR